MGCWQGMEDRIVLSVHALQSLIACSWGAWSRPGCRKLVPFTSGAHRLRASTALSSSVHRNHKWDKSQTTKAMVFQKGSCGQGTAGMGVRCSSHHAVGQGVPEKTVGPWMMPGELAQVWNGLWSLPQPNSNRNFPKDPPDLARAASKAQCLL